MSLQEEYNALEFLKGMLKTDEIFCKNNGTDTFQRDCLRKSIEIIANTRKAEIEQIYQSLLKDKQENKDEKESKENNDERKQLSN